MANTVTTSIVVQFSQGQNATGTLLVEVDDRAVIDGGLNGGKTSFLPGDPVSLLLYKTSDVILDAAITSLGSLASGTLVTVTKTEDITFANETEASLRYPVLGALNSVVWIGANLGSIAMTSETGLRVPAAPVGQYGVGIARITYTTQARIYTLTHSDPGYSEYPIVVFFAGHTP